MSVIVALYLLTKMEKILLKQRISNLQQVKQSENRNYNSNNWVMISKVSPFREIKVNIFYFNIRVKHKSLIHK